MRIEIRKVLPEDSEKYVQTHIDCWKAAYRDIIPDEFLDNMQNQLEQRTESVRQTLQDPGDRCFYCAQIDENIVGRLIFGKDQEESNPDIGEIHAIYLLEEYWGKGYGTQMLDYALTELKNAGYREIHIWVLEKNHRARRFYEKHGFRLDEAKKDVEVGKVLTTIRYSLDL